MSHFVPENLIAISGCPRSRTSLMMNAIGHAVGLDRIVGYKWPHDQRRLMEEEQYGHVPEAMEYIRKLKANEDDQRVEHTTDMNPSGFWEHGSYTMKGMRRTPPTIGHISTIKPNSFIKIVSQGIAKTEVGLISKVVYMNRHPRAVAKSQEKLNRGPRVKNNGVVHTPAMYNQVHWLAAEWFLMNPEVEVMVVDSDAMLNAPALWFHQIGEFIGVNLMDSVKLIDPKLNRSKHEDVDSPLWADAEMTWTLVNDAAWGSVAEYYGSEIRETAIESLNWPCARRGMDVSDIMCQRCTNDPRVMYGFRNGAENQGIDWRNEPCLYECGLNPRVGTYTPISIDQSISKNHWRDGTQVSRGLGDDIEKVADAAGIKKCKGCGKRQKKFNDKFPRKGRKSLPDSNAKVEQ